MTHQSAKSYLSGLSESASVMAYTQAKPAARNSRLATAWVVLILACNLCCGVWSNIYAADNTLACAGNSITLGTGSDFPWPSMLSNYFGPTWGVTNAGQNGLTTTAMHDSRINNIFAFKTAPRNFVLVWEGGNDIFFDEVADGFGAYTNLTNYCWRMTTNGQIPIICTIPKRTDLSGSKETARVDCNVLISNTWSQFAAGIIQFHTNTLLDYTVTPANFWVDSIHPNEAGNRVISNQVVAFFSAFSIPVRIGSESAVTTPASAHYSTTINIRPGIGETVSNNPPIFTWFYNTNHMTGGELNPNGFTDHFQTRTNAFQFQVATNSAFTGTLAVDVNTPFNFYNFIGVLPTNVTRTLYWRVKYVVGGTPYFTNGPYSFTIINGAANWDRSLLADANYHATNSFHPMFCFRSNEQNSVMNYVTNQARSYLDLTNAAVVATNASWWTDHSEWAVNATRDAKFATPVTDGFGRANNIGAVLLLWAVSGDNRWTNASMTGWLVTNAAHLCNWFVSPSNNYPMLDYGDSESAIPIRVIVAMYDWMYHYLGSDTGTFNGQLRTNCVQAARLTARFWNYNDLWSATNAPVGTYLKFYDYKYAAAANFNVGAASTMKQDNSHGSMSINAVLPIATMGDADPEITLFRDMHLNHKIARTSGFAGWAAHHIGVYGYVDNNIYNRTLQSGLMILRIAYPQAQLERTEFLKRFPEWYSRLIPYGKRLYHGPYGDGLPGGNAGYSFGTENRGLDLSLLTGSGYARQLYDLNREFSNTFWQVSSHFDELPIRYHFSLPAAATNTTSAFYPEDGMVVASSKSPSEFDSYTNAVAFSFKAAPRGNYQNHQVPDALTIDMSAYGAQLTDIGGDNLNTYGYRADSGNGLFINGYGSVLNAAHYSYSQTSPMDASIVNYTNSGTNFVYVSADATSSFTNYYYAAQGGLNFPFGTNAVTKVRRDVLFVCSKYWIIYDSFATTNPCTFMWQWQVPFAFRYEAGGTALANEHKFNANLLGSNSLAIGVSGFTYVAGNYADAAYQNPPRAKVFVHYVTTNQGTFVATGTNNLSATTASVIGTANTNSTLNPLRNTTFSTVHPNRSAKVIVTNYTPTTNWHFMTVIYPVQPGETDPVISRIDDHTVKVVRDGFTETNTFSTNYSGAYTFMVDVASTADNPGGAPGEESGVGSAILRGVIMRGAFVK